MAAQHPLRLCSSKHPLAPTGRVTRFRGGAHSHKHTALDVAGALASAWHAKRNDMCTKPRGLSGAPRERCSPHPGPPRGVLPRASQQAPDLVGRLKRSAPRRVDRHGAQLVAPRGVGDGGLLHGGVDRVQGKREARDVGVQADLVLRTLAWGLCNRHRPLGRLLLPLGFIAWVNNPA